MPRAVRWGTRPARTKTELYGDCRMRRTPQDEAKPNALLMVARALLLRCPNCGAGGLFASWFKLRSACAVCGLVLERAASIRPGRGSDGHQAFPKDGEVFQRPA